MHVDPVFGGGKYERYAQLRASAPVTRIVAPPGAPAPPQLWLVTRYDDVQQALLDPRLGLEPPEQYSIGTTSLLSSDPPDHTRLRRAVGGLFSRRRMAALRPSLQAIADELIDAFPPNGTIDVIERYAFPFPMAVICQLLGVPADDHADFRRWTVDFFGADEDTPHARPAAVASLYAYLTELLASRRARPTDDLVSEMIADVDGGLSDDELVSTLMLFLVAGHETSVNLIGNGLLALLLHIDQLKLPREDPSGLPAAIEEMLRFDSPVSHAVIRFAGADLEIGGVPIAAGDAVLLGLGSANHDNVLVHEDVFDVRRPAVPHLAFGHGIHYCLGAPLARLEGQIAFETLLRRVPDLVLACTPDELRWRSSLLMSGLHGLPLRIGAVTGSP